MRSLIKTNPDPAAEAEPSTEIALVSSAEEIEIQLRSEAAARIDDAAVKLGLEKIQTRIRQHYEDRARKMIYQIWKDCKKRTGHRIDEVTDDDSYYRHLACVTCHRPYKKDGDGDTVFDFERAEEGIKKIGHQLREADREAGIEWIPKR